MSVEAPQDNGRQPYPLIAAGQGEAPKIEALPSGTM